MSGHLHATQMIRWWSPDPLVIASVAIAASLYAAGTARLWRRAGRGHGVRSWEAACYAGGLLTILTSLISPLDRLSDILFSAHMTQHELLMLVAAPLIVIGRPLIPFLWGIPQRWREKVGRWSQGEAVKATWRRITGGVFVLVAHAIVIWVWHIPALFQSAMRNEGIHAFQHLCFFITAALFWWAVVHGHYGRLGYGLGVLFVFTTAVHTSILGALLTFSASVLYPLYGATAAQWNVDALQDQQLAGLIMWIPTGLVFILAALALFAAWLGESERRVSYTTSESLTREVSRGA